MNIEQAKALSSEDFHRRAAAMRPETRMVIDGKLLPAQSGKQFETVNPATGEVVATVPLGDAAEADLAVAAARRAFKSGIWSRMEPRSRMEVLYRFAAAINEQCAGIRPARLAGCRKAGHGHDHRRRSGGGPDLSILR